MSSLQKLTATKSKARRNLGFERTMAIVVSANLLLVLFDLSYIPLRDFWLLGKIKVFGFTLGIDLPGGTKFPVTQWYDNYKGIQPHRETDGYLKRVDELQKQINQTGMRSPKVEIILKDRKSVV
jgi:hypothetical protein